MSSSLFLLDQLLLLLLNSSSRFFLSAIDLAFCSTRAATMEEEVSSATLSPMSPQDPTTALSSLVDESLTTRLLPDPSLDAFTVADIDWRVDVLVSSDAVTRVSTPTIVLSLLLSDGTRATYRLSQEELHQWRFSLAKAVKDLAYLEQKRPPPPSVKRTWDPPTSTGSHV